MLVVECRLLVDDLLLHFLFLFFCFRPGCYTLFYLLLLRAILRFLWCFLLLLALFQSLFVPLHVFLCLRSFCVVFFLLRYVSHCDIYIWFLLLHRTRGLSGRSGGQLFMKGLGALRKDSCRRHRGYPCRGLRLGGLVTGAPCVTCVNTGTILIFPRSFNPMSQGCVFTLLWCVFHLCTLRSIRNNN
jgi:hypothetical protein